jgi:hypothetical protein
MAVAKSTLEALLVNDPGHPAIRNFICEVQAIINIADRTEDIKVDVAAFFVIKYELKKLKEALLA